MTAQTPIETGEALLEAARALEPLVREHADRGEHERRLPDPVAEAFARIGVFRMCRPRAIGGLEVDPPTALRVFEALSRADGSAGWVAMIFGAGGAIEAYIPAEGAAAMYREDPAVATTGVLAPSGRAVEAEGGFRVSGRWALASGCQHARWLGGTCVIMDGEAPRMGPGGMPASIVAMLPASDCEIVDTWRVAGLRGTGSHDFTVDDVFVPVSRCISQPMMEPSHEGALFRFPFFGFLSAAISSTALGIARASIDELVRLAKHKTPFGTRSKLQQRPSAQLAVAEAEAAVASGRALLMDAVERLWRAVEASEEISVEDRARLRLAASNATASAARAADLMYTAGGATALYDESPLQRCFRDVHAITQHFTVAPASQQLLGQILLGDPEADTMLL
ncbi:MAG TPA: acyl-CoA dehydrogenase family protein [Sandaracinaceae bacterium LLY-WYZ-13_1]|nr:acyl-CoA dehydrogenase family protein [Sandaracinaceae bacterium LLY-WYZ-13_1]